MKLNFEFIGKAIIAHLTIRKEGAEKHDLAIDIKVTGDAGADLLYQVLGCAKSKAAHFWDKQTTENRPSFSGLAGLDCDSEFLNCEVLIDSRRFVGCKVHKFKLVPSNENTLEVVCMISLSGVSDADAGYLCEIYRESAAITVNGEPDMIGDGTSPAGDA